MLRFIKYFLGILFLVIVDVESKIINNEILLPDDRIINNITEFEVVTSLDSPYVYRDADPAEKKVLNIVVNPIIHNVAQGFGGEPTEKPPATTTLPSVTTQPPLLADIIRVFLRKIKFLGRFLWTSAKTLIGAAIRFVICTFVPICGLFGVFSDEMPVDFNSTATPEGVARGLDFIQGIIEQYHNLQNHTLF